MNVLFLCTSNVNRSRTAEEHFKAIDSSNIYRSAGLSAKYCAKEGSRLCRTEDLDWADRVYVMEQMHVDRIAQYAGPQYLAKVVNLNIEDIYRFMDEQLIILLENKVGIAQ